MTNSLEMRKLGDIWTFLIGFEFDEIASKGRVTILDVGGDGCYNFTVENNFHGNKAADFQFSKKGKTGTKDIF